MDRPKRALITRITGQDGVHLPVQHDESDDFVLATGETPSIEEFLTLAPAEAGIDDWHPYVRQDPDLLRPAEVDVVLGKPAKAERVLGWKREISFPALVHWMVTYDVALHHLGSHLRALRTLRRTNMLAEVTSSGGSR